MVTYLRFGGFCNSIHNKTLKDFVDDFFLDQHGYYAENSDDIHDEIKWKELQEFYCKKLVDFINQEFYLSLKFRELWSPKEGNSTHDVILLKFEDYELDKILAGISTYKDYHEMTSKYLKYWTTPREGFIPLYTMEEIILDRELMMGIYLEILYSEVIMEELQCDWFDYIHDSLWELDIKEYMNNWVEPIYK